MARSRQRERELARRRYERRRLREQQLRAKRRRRNTLLGAIGGTLLVLALLVVGGIWLFTGGGKAKPNAKSSPSASSTAAPTTCAKISPNPPQNGGPKVPDVIGKAPTTLATKDVTVGNGAVAKAGSDLMVTYIGVSCSTGKVFDASYLHGNQPFEVKPLGSAGVIAGWNQGLIGVRAGGVRELVIPASLGYGAQGSGAIKPNETLIFLITVKSVT